MSTPIVIDLLVVSIYFFLVSATNMGSVTSDYSWKCFCFDCSGSLSSFELHLLVSGEKL